MIGNSLVILTGIEISYNEYAVKSRKDGGLQLDLLRNLLQLIIPAKNRIGCCKHGSARVEPSCNPCFCHTDGLLLHGFVDGHSVLWLHLIKLVNAHYATIRKH